MGNDMDKKGILTVRMMGTISVEYEGEFFPVGTALTGKILQLLLILLYAGKKGVGREELLDVFYGNGEYANPSAIYEKPKSLLQINIGVDFGGSGSGFWG